MSRLLPPAPSHRSNSGPRRSPCTKTGPLGGSPSQAPSREACPLWSSPEAGRQARFRAPRSLASRVGSRLSRSGRSRLPVLVKVRRVDRRRRAASRPSRLLGSRQVLASSPLLVDPLRPWRHPERDRPALRPWRHPQRDRPPARSPRSRSQQFQRRRPRPRAEAATPSLTRFDRQSRIAVVRPRRCGPGPHGRQHPGRRHRRFLRFHPRIPNRRKTRQSRQNRTSMEKDRRPCSRRSPRARRPSPQALRGRAAIMATATAKARSRTFAALRLAEFRHCRDGGDAGVVLGLFDAQRLPAWQDQ